jgi:hypothetical protein
MTRSLAVLALLSCLLYGAALAHGDFRPGRIEPFFPIYIGLFVLYAAACWLVLRPTVEPKAASQRILLIFGGAMLFNIILIPSRPTLSDDMYRYIWDGRVQAAGINPYQYRSSAPELADLRDETIYARMNRPDAVTIYPPGAQIAFAAIWRVFPDSIAGIKFVFIMVTLVGGGLLMLLLRAFDQPPERALILLWNPLLIFEIAHAAHVDALYLPLIIGAFLLRARSPGKRVDGRYELAIGVLIGLATLVKLYPAMLAVCLWSVRDVDGRRKLRLLLPIGLIVTVALGYALYLQPGINVFGFLGSYGREFFNVSPLMHGLIDLARGFGLRWWTVGSYGMPLLIIVVSLACMAFPARTYRSAIQRCGVMIWIYLLINHNLFSWYALWLLPLSALDLELRPLRFNLALSGWAFTGTLALSYVFFIDWREQAWAIALQFLPVYVLLIAACWFAVRPAHLLMRRRKA